MAGLGAAPQSNAERGSATRRTETGQGQWTPGKPGWSHPRPVRSTVSSGTFYHPAAGSATEERLVVALTP